MSDEIGGDEVEDFVRNIIQHLKEDRKIDGAPHHAFVLMASGCAYIANVSGISREEFMPLMKSYCGQVFDHFEEIEKQEQVH